jgi:hypothetical protein
MLPFGVTIPATVPPSSEIPEGIMNYLVFWYFRVPNDAIWKYVYLNYVGTFKDIQFIPLYYFRRDDVVNRKV